VDTYLPSFSPLSFSFFLFFKEKEKEKRGCAKNSRRGEKKANRGKSWLIRGYFQKNVDVKLLINMENVLFC